MEPSHSNENVHLSALHPTFSWSVHIIYSGYSLIDGDSLFISNLSNGIDLYSLHSMQWIRHYEHAVTINVPLQVALAKQALDWVVMGGVDGIICIYDHASGELIHQLEHCVGGCVQVINVSDYWIGRQPVAHEASDAEYTQNEVDCCCLIHSWQEV